MHRLMKKDKNFYKKFAFIIMNNLRKHSSTEETYNANRITVLVLSAKIRFVHLYTEMLISNEFNEILIKYYSKKEALKQLKNILNLYSNYVHVFPNYAKLDVRDVMIDNISDKQNLMNYFYENAFLESYEENEDDLHLGDIFDLLSTEFVDSKSKEGENKLSNNMYMTPSMIKIKEGEVNDMNDSIDGVEHLIGEIRLAKERARIKKEKEKKKKEKNQNMIKNTHKIGSISRIDGDLYNGKKSNQTTKQLTRFSIRNYINNYEKNNKQTTEDGVQNTKMNKETYRFYVKQYEKERFKINFKGELDIIRNNIFTKIVLLQKKKTLTEEFFKAVGSHRSNPHKTKAIINNKYNYINILPKIK